MKLYYHFRAVLKKSSLLLTLYAVIVFYSFGQSPFPQNYFASPLEIPLSLAGNYGEIRLNHFHYGIDFRTNNKEGYKVLASADGFVSRVKVSGYGYGKAVYIDHPNGYTTVYAHLAEITGALGDHVRKKQLENESFEYEYYPKPGEFQITKGQMIGLSGNTGGSQGPHLHFEIRDTKSEDPMNPQLFGLSIQDKIAPVLEAISIYEIAELDEWNTRKDHVYRIGEVNLKDTVFLPSNAGFGFRGYDRETGTGSKNGIYEVILLLNKDTFFHSRLDRMSFEQSRFVNGHIDYALKISENKVIERAYKVTNNEAPVYLKMIDNGRISNRKGFCGNGKFILKDISGNQSEYRFYFMNERSSPKKTEKVCKGQRFSVSADNLYSKGDVKVSVPMLALYYDVDFNVTTRLPFKGFFSSVYSIHSKKVPLQRAMKVSIKPKPVSEELRKKLVIVSVTEKGQMQFASSEWDGEFITAETKSFGNYGIYLDTVAPFARHVGFKRGMKLQDTRKIQVRAYDNLGDVKTYRGMIDGKWKLFEFDAKSDTFTHRFESPADGKTHTLSFECTDERGNKTVISVPFIR